MVCLFTITTLLLLPHSGGAYYFRDVEGMSKRLYGRFLAAGVQIGMPLDQVDQMIGEGARVAGSGNGLCVRYYRFGFTIICDRQRPGPWCVEKVLFDGPIFSNTQLRLITGVLHATRNWRNTGLP
jgi:hypothetical protein